MRRILGLSLALVALVALVPLAHAQSAPIQVALFPPAQLVPVDRSVSGVRLDLLYGKNADVTGVDWGLVNHDTGSGFAWQLGAVNYVEKNFLGYQEGWVNVTRAQFTGFQSGLYNQSQSMNGVALGWVNVTKDMHGVQIGFVNFTETMRGLQIGIGNIIQKGKIPFLPIVNWSF